MKTGKNLVLHRAKLIRTFLKSRRVHTFLLPRQDANILRDLLRGGFNHTTMTNLGSLEPATGAKAIMAGSRESTVR
jgi:hypothetical protein